MRNFAVGRLRERNCEVMRGRATAVADKSLRSRCHRRRPPPSMTRRRSTLAFALALVGSGGVIVVSSATGRQDDGSPTPANVSVPRISGDLAVAGTVSASSGAWSGSQGLGYSYQWQACDPACSDIVGATGATYVPSGSDLGRQLRVIVTAAASAGSALAASSLTPRVAPAAAVLRAALLAQLVPPDPPLTVALELQTRGYVLPLRVLTRGRALIDWYLGSHPGFVAAGGRGVLVGSGAARFYRVDDSRAYAVSQGRVTIKATRVGKRLVRGSRSMTLTAVATFIPDWSARVSATTSFKLS